MTGVVCGSRYVDDDLFIETCRRAATGLNVLGVVGGVSFAILMRNDVDFMIAQSAAVAAGGQVVLLNWHATADEIGYVLRDAEVKVLIAHADLLKSMRRAIPSNCRILVVPTPAEILASFGLSPEAGRVDDTDVNWTEWLAGYPASPPEKVEHRGLLGISYTSGTTGRPKGVQREVPDVRAAARLQLVVDEILGVQPGENVRVLVSAPIYHGAPNFFANRGAPAGSLTVLQPRFEPEQLLQLVERYGVTHVYMVPTTMLKLLNLPSSVRSKYDLSSLRRIVHSAAPCPRDLKQRMIEWLGPIIYEFYGGTECGSITILSSEDAIRKSGSVGSLLQNASVEICDEQGRPLPRGQVGEIFARNFNIPRFSYRNLPEKQAEVERGELVSIGDVGYLDEEGFLFLCDRKRDMVISAGVNIYPAELEGALMSMPGVADCVVFGVPDPVFGESLCAHVEPRAGFSIAAQDVIDWMRQRVARYQVPQRVVIDHALPREDSGKIMKRKIRDQYWAQTGRKI